MPLMPLIYKKKKKQQISTQKKGNKNTTGRSFDKLL